MRLFYLLRRFFFGYGTRRLLMDKANQFLKWCSERMGHPHMINFAREAIKEQQAEIESLRAQVESGSNCITHLKQAVYNVAKSSFDEGAEWAFADPHPELSLLDASVVFAKNIHSEMVTVSDSIHKQPIAKENDCE